MSHSPESDEPPDCDPASLDSRAGQKKETFKLLICPAPGCGSRGLKPNYAGDCIEGFICANGCRFSAKRNVFTGEIMYYKLDFTILTGPDQAHPGMRFLTSGEPYSEWI
jgi:hypothetical protein